MKKYSPLTDLNEASLSLQWGCQCRGLPQRVFCCSATSSGKVLRQLIACMQVHIPGRLLSTVKLAINANNFPEL